MLQSPNSTLWSRAGQRRRPKVQAARVHSAASSSDQVRIMSILGIIILIVCIWLFFKVAGALFKLALVIAAIAVAWYLLAPLLGMPRPF